MNTRPPLTSLDFLRGFIAAASTGSFTKAADQLALTQSAVSRQVKALEEALGVTLFLRGERGLSLTPEGRTLLDVAAPALADIDATARRLMRRGDDGTVLVGTTLSFASLWLVPRLGDLQRQHPELKIRIAADNTLVPLASSDLDVAIRFCPASLASDTSGGQGQAQATLLFNERVTPVCTPSLLQQYPELAHGDVSRAPLIHMDIGHRPWPWVTWEAWFEAIGGTVPQTGGLWLSHYEQVIEAALSGQGVALGRLPLIDRMIASGRLVAPIGQTIGVGRDIRGYYVVLPAASLPKRSARVFRDWLLQVGGTPS